MKIYCFNCETPVSDQATACPKCGHPLTATEGPPNVVKGISKTKTLTISSVVLAVCLYMMIVQFFKGSQAKNNLQAPSSIIPGMTVGEVDYWARGFDMLEYADSFTGHTQNALHMACALSREKYRFFDDNQLVDHTVESLNRVISDDAVINNKKYDGFEVMWSLGHKGRRQCSMSIDRDGHLLDEQFAAISQKAWLNVAGLRVKSPNPFDSHLWFLVDLATAERNGVDVKGKVKRFERSNHCKITHSSYRLDAGKWDCRITLTASAKDYQYEIMVQEGEDDSSYAPWSRLVVFFTPTKNLN